jgi:hypothetical protein
MGDYFANPRAYDPKSSFRRHVEGLMGEEGAPLGVELSRWFTAEWAAIEGDGFLSSEANLPALYPEPGTRAQRTLLFAALRETLTPLADFKRRFSRALMPPQVAGSLAPYAHLLTEYAQAVLAFCDAMEREGVGPREPAARLLARVDRPETECFRLPFSLIRYARRLATL